MNEMTYTFSFTVEHAPEINYASGLLVLVIGLLITFFIGVNLIKKGGD